MTIESGTSRSVLAAHRRRVNVHLPRRHAPNYRTSTSNHRRFSIAITGMFKYHKRRFMAAYLWIAFGGALGSVARYGLSDWITGLAERHDNVFPWGTLVVNISGSFLIGLLFAWSEPGGRRWIGPAGRQFFMYGFCGGYTTFSSFSLQTLNLIREREWLSAGGNVLMSVCLCLIAVWLGYLFGITLNSTKGA